MDLYGGFRLKKFAAGLLRKYAQKCQNAMGEALRAYPQFRRPEPFAHLRELAGKYLGEGNKMGAGWLLTAEMIELYESGAANIVCTQPFGCLPNHICGKGMMKPIKKRNPSINIIAIDYDAGASVVNQQNRIKLMLAAAKRETNGTTDAVTETESEKVPQ